MKKRIFIKKTMALMLCLTTLISFTGCIKKEAKEDLVKTDAEILEEKLSAKTNDCFDLCVGQFYVWHDENTDDIKDDLVSSSEKAEEKFKDYDGYIFSPVYNPVSTLNNNYGDSYFGREDRIFTLTDKEVKKVPVLSAGDKIVYYTNEDMPTSFAFEKFITDDNYTFGMAFLEADETDHIFISINDGFFAGNSTMNKVYESLIKDINNKVSAAKKFIVDEINNTKVTFDNVEPTYGYILGLNENEEYLVHGYYGSIQNNYKVKADSKVFFSSLDSSFVTTNYELYNSTIAVIEIPELTEGYYYINEMGTFKYQP